ncbi:MAG: exodeoxyribonuclease III [Martelella sp.]|uniref:exodeoxyribonuclease III n=1 Tax=unclassified Martelella TaxID=2629616 RepID=UPI000C3544DB|nr:exodeoxyribonuclease III [Martelella sp.]MAU19762.1 exodeoxyribonuclease III [Martelella sp.]|tara:strand:+ start:466 stop:1257 length:792 start_codon:yes stop_codon:yes gene_type:complete
MKIATWNINGIKARQENLVRWLEMASPDIVCLQEIKSVDENFPAAPFQDLGYHVETHGQKGFNGVALLSKKAPEDVQRGFSDGHDDDQSRYIEGVFSVKDGVIRVASIYLPNGNPVDTPKYPYKLAWMERLKALAKERLSLEEPLVLAGDYNVIPRPCDCHDPAVWAGDALFLPQTREAFSELLGLGLYDAVAGADEAGGQYTFWDYQAGAWQKNNGIRIDHMLLSAEAADRLAATSIDKSVRSWEKPSDHVPVICQFDCAWA